MDWSLGFDELPLYRGPRTNSWKFIASRFEAYEQQEQLSKEEQSVRVNVISPIAEWLRVNPELSCTNEGLDSTSEHQNLVPPRERSRDAQVATMECSVGMPRRELPRRPRGPQSELRSNVTKPPLGDEVKSIISHLRASGAEKPELQRRSSSHSELLPLVCRGPCSDCGRERSSKSRDGKALLYLHDNPYTGNNGRGGSRRHRYVHQWTSWY